MFGRPLLDGPDALPLWLSVTLGDELAGDPGDTGLIGEELPLAGEFLPLSLGSQTSVQAVPEVMEVIVVTADAPEIVPETADCPDG